MAGLLSRLPPALEIVLVRGRMDQAEGRRSTEGASFKSPGRSPGDSLPKASSRFATAGRCRRFHPVGVSNVRSSRFPGLRPGLLNLTPSGSGFPVANAARKAGRSLKLAASMPVHIGSPIVISLGRAPSAHQGRNGSPRHYARCASRKSSSDDFAAVWQVIESSVPSAPSPATPRKEPLPYGNEQLRGGKRARQSS